MSYDELVTAIHSDLCEIQQVTASIVSSLVQRGEKLEDVAARARALGDDAGKFRRRTGCAAGFLEALESLDEWLESANNRLGDMIERNWN